MHLFVISSYVKLGQEKPLTENYCAYCGVWHMESTQVNLAISIVPGVESMDSASDNLDSNDSPIWLAG